MGRANPALGAPPIGNYPRGGFLQVSGLGLGVAGCRTRRVLDPVLFVRFSKEAAQEYRETRIVEQIEEGGRRRKDLLDDKDQQEQDGAQEYCASKDPEPC